MAPVQNTNSTEATVAPAAAKDFRCEGLGSSWDMLLPISHRGAFFQDQFFSSIHQHFDAAIRQILDRWSDTDVGPRHSDRLDRYRRLRSMDLKEENQAVTVHEDHATHKIVLDVHEFLGGDVEVKLVGEEELIVEGRVQRKEERDSTSHSFRRRFVLPRQTDKTAITSAISSDGILTVTVPKMKSDVQQKTTLIPVKMEEVKQNSQETISSAKDLRTGSQNCVQPKTSVKDTASMATQEKERQTSKTQTQSSTHSDSKEMSSSFFLPIGHRGLFFDDSFFQESWKDFQKAVKDVLSKWGEGPAVGDDLSRYRRLRSVDLREENQAVASSENDRQHKFVLDVKDFIDGGEVSVKATNERELVVEGRTEAKEGGSVSSQRFHRRFVLPRDIQLDEVKSAVSSDGVLTISAPKKQTTHQLQEITVPITIEGKQQISNDTNSSEINKNCVQGSAVKGNEHQDESPLSSRKSGTHSVSNVSSKSNATQDPAQTFLRKISDTAQKESSYQNQKQNQRILEHVQDPKTTVSSSNSKNADIDISTTSSTASVKGKAAAEIETKEEQELYQLKGNGANFPIKINGAVINANCL